VWLVPVRREEEVGKGHGRVNMVQILCIYMYVNGKVIPVKTTLEMVG
jgi:hypothetical protein